MHSKFASQLIATTLADRSQVDIDQSKDFHLKRLPAASCIPRAQVGLQN